MLLPTESVSKMVNGPSENPPRHGNGPMIGTCTRQPPAQQNDAPNVVVPTLENDTTGGDAPQTRAVDCSLGKTTGSSNAPMLGGVHHTNQQGNPIVGVASNPENSTTSGSNAPMLGGVGPDGNGQNNSSGVMSNSKNNIVTGENPTMQGGPSNHGDQQGAPILLALTDENETAGADVQLQDGSSHRGNLQGHHTLRDSTDENKTTDTTTAEPSNGGIIVLGENQLVEVIED